MAWEWEDGPPIELWNGENTRDLAPRAGKKKSRPFKIEIRYHRHPDKHYPQWKAGNYWYGRQAFSKQKTALQRMEELRKANTNPPIYSIKSYRPDEKENELERFGVFLNGSIDIEYRLVGPKE